MRVTPEKEKTKDAAKIIEALDQIKPRQKILYFTGRGLSLSGKFTIARAAYATFLAGRCLLVQERLEDGRFNHFAIGTTPDNFEHWKKEAKAYDDFSNRKF